MLRTGHGQRREKFVKAACAKRITPLHLRMIDDAGRMVEE
jgi:hypothetical protein